MIPEDNAKWLREWSEAAPLTHCRPRLQEIADQLETLSTTDWPSVVLSLKEIMPDHWVDYCIRMHTKEE